MQALQALQNELQGVWQVFVMLWGRLQVTLYCKEDKSSSKSMVSVVSTCAVQAGFFLLMLKLHFL